MERESMEFDVVVVGGGPAGLATAIRLKQRANEKGEELNVVVLEKGSEIGAHILSGAIMDPIAMNELFPNWKELGAPLNCPVTEDRFKLLTEPNAINVPHFAMPKAFDNKGNYIVSLGNVCRWMAEQAEGLGVEIYPGFPAVEVLFNEDGSVRGVLSGDFGVDREGNPKEGMHQPGMELLGKYTIFAEGCRGQLGKSLIAGLGLDAESDPQQYGIGIKELWEIDPAKHKEGLALHTAGWPMKQDTYGGSWMYHMENNMVSLGFVVGLEYSNPHLSPFQELQRWKTHPDIKHFLEGGKRISYGARAIVAGGLQSLPKLVFPGGALVGDDAGFLNVPRIKGSHAAIKTGMLAADACFDALQEGRSYDELTQYPEEFRESWLHKELHKARNFKPYMKKGLVMGMALGGMELKLFGGNTPWTLRHKNAPHENLKPADQCEKIDYPKPDGVLTFDRLGSVFISNTNHEEEQPCHLKLKNDAVPVATNLKVYGGPEFNYCPAGVYEFVEDEGSKEQRLQINAQNCVHCKTCDIKDPTQNINWEAPEGAGGPNYPNM